jgi:hypothetical protein
MLPVDRAASGLVDREIGMARELAWDIEAPHSRGFDIKTDVRAELARPLSGTASGALKPRQRGFFYASAPRVRGLETKEAGLRRPPSMSWGLGLSREPGCCRA